MITRPRLPFLETMITQACNLSCLGCTNYSDLSHSGYVSWQKGKQWLESWLERIDIPDFGIMGGEPLINPECLDWIQGVRSLMPSAQIRFTTNGLLLHKYPDLVDQLIDIGNVSFKITVHLEDQGLENLINDIMQRYPWRPVTEHGIPRYITRNQLRLHVKRPDRFLKTYQNSYENMLPWDSDPMDAFAKCVQQTCPLLYQGKIYKCSTSGLLAATLARFGNPNFDRWRRYLAEGLEARCTDQSLQEFIDNFGHAHSQCGQCPSAHHHEGTVVHFNRVRKK
jgi:organic radical activating enzyme